MSLFLLGQDQSVSFSHTKSVCSVFSSGCFALHKRFYYKAQNYMNLLTKDLPYPCIISFQISKYF